VSEGELGFPFARELREQHDALRTAVRWFQAELGAQRAREPGRAAHARDFVREFREQLVQHFRFEELNGFEGAFGSDDPEVQGWARELIRQHHAFERELSGLLEQLELCPAGAAVPGRLLGELAAFFGARRRHDAEENAFMLRISRGPLDFEREAGEP
jgi:hypothetical protein